MDTAKVMSKGQVTIPKRIRDLLNLENGDYVTFIVDEWRIQIVNSKTFIEDNIQSRKQIINVRYLQEELMDKEKTSLQNINAEKTAIRLKRLLRLQKMQKIVHIEKLMKN